MEPDNTTEEIVGPTPPEGVETIEEPQEVAPEESSEQTVEAEPVEVQDKQVYYLPDTDESVEASSYEEAANLAGSHNASSGN